MHISPLMRQLLRDAVQGFKGAWKLQGGNAKHEGALPELGLVFREPGASASPPLESKPVALLASDSPAGAHGFPLIENVFGRSSKNIT